MNGLLKFRRVARNIVESFEKDYEMNEDEALKTLKIKLLNLRKPARRYVKSLLKARHPEINYD